MGAKYIDNLFFATVHTMMRPLLCTNVMGWLFSMTIDRLTKSQEQRSCPSVASSGRWRESAPRVKSWPEEVENLLRCLHPPPGPSSWLRAGAKRTGLWLAATAFSKLPASLVLQAGLLDGPVGTCPETGTVRWTWGTTIPSHREDWPIFARLFQTWKSSKDAKWYE